MQSQAAEGHVQSMMTVRLKTAVCFLFVSACAEETPSHSVDDFMEDRILLEATMVRCGQNRSTSRYDLNCANAREAADRIGAAEAQARREAREAESERKREELRRARDAADERRRQAEEAERERREAEEFGLFEPLPYEEPATQEPAGDEEGATDAAGGGDTDQRDSEPVTSEPAEAPRPAEAEDEQ